MPSQTTPKPPVADQISRIDTLHGDTRRDNYFWLREKDNPAVTDYLNAENEYAERILAHTEAFQKTLYDEMLDRIKETDLSVPFTDNGYSYFFRTEEGKQYETYCRKKESMDGDEEVMLDLNRMAEDKPFMALGTYTVSDDNHHLAYSIDETGFRQYTLFIKDLRSGELLPERVERVGAVVWAVCDISIRIWSTTVRMVVVDCVVTHPEHREQGLMTQTARTPSKTMKSKRYIVSLLNGINDFYDRFRHATVWPQCPKHPRECYTVKIAYGNGRSGDNR